MISSFDTQTPFIDTTPSALHHMEVDKDAVENLTAPPLFPFLRFYTWPRTGAITLGRFLQKDKLLNEDECVRREISIAMRPTGGGLLIHGPFDCAFSLLLPAGHPLITADIKENYRRIHAMIEKALKKSMGYEVLEESDGLNIAEDLLRLEAYCMASKTQYDILLHGVKVGGSACRITKRGLLFQASIFIDEPAWDLFLPVLHNGEEAIEEMKNGSSYLNAFPLYGELKALRISDIQKSIYGSIQEGLSHLG